MKDIATLLPTLREKERYVVFEILCTDKDIELESFIRALNHSLNYFFGVVLTSKMSVWVMKGLYDSSRRVGVIRTNSESTEYVRFALTSIKEIDGEEVCIRVRGVSGTLKGARIKYLD